MKDMNKHIYTQTSKEESVESLPSFHWKLQGAGTHHLHHLVQHVHPWRLSGSGKWLSTASINLAPVKLGSPQLPGKPVSSKVLKQRNISKIKPINQLDQYLDFWKLELSGVSDSHIYLQLNHDFL